MENNNNNNRNYSNFAARKSKNANSGVNPTLKYLFFALAIIFIGLLFYLFTRKPHEEPVNPPQFEPQQVAQVQSLQPNPYEMPYYAPQPQPYSEPVQQIPQPAQQQQQQQQTPQQTESLTSHIIIPSSLFEGLKGGNAASSVGSGAILERLRALSSSSPLTLRSPAPSADVQTVITYILKRGQTLDKSLLSQDMKSALAAPTAWVPQISNQSGFSELTYYFPKGITTKTAYRLYYDTNANAWNIKIAT